MSLLQRRQAVHEKERELKLTNVTGLLVKDPDTRGDLIEITVADNPVGDKEKARYVPDFVRATLKADSVFGRMAAECRKGQKVLVIGKEKRREYEHNGRTGVSNEIPFVDHFEKCFENKKGDADGIATSPGAAAPDPFGM